MKQMLSMLLKTKPLSRLHIRPFFFPNAYQAPETQDNLVAAVPCPSCPGNQPPWAFEAGRGWWLESEVLPPRGWERGRGLKECSWGAGGWRGIGNTGTCEWHRPQGMKSSSVVGYKSRPWQVWTFLVLKWVPLAHLRAHLVSFASVKLRARRILHEH